MRVILKCIAPLAAVTALAACSPGTNVLRSFYAQAGSELNEGGFGSPTNNNLLVQTGKRGYTINLARRFAAEVPSTVNFAFNSTVLDAGAQANLLKQSDWIRQFPEVRFRVYGHTDLVGTDAYNKRLGLRRARVVVKFLTRHGISRSRLQAMVSYGETQPLIATGGPERRNRRTVTEVSGFVKNNPMVLNGKYAQVVIRQYVESATEEPRYSTSATTVETTAK